MDVVPCNLFGHHTGAAIAVAMKHLFPDMAPTVALPPQGVKSELGGRECTYVCERQADMIAARLADFFGDSGA